MVFVSGDHCISSSCTFFMQSVLKTLLLLGRHRERTVYWKRWLMIGCLRSRTSGTGDSASQNALKTTTINSVLLVPWLLLKCNHYHRGTEPTKLQRTCSCLEWVRSIALQGCAKFEPLPSIIVNGLQLQLRKDGYIDLAQMAGVWASLPDEWETVRTLDTHVDLAAWGDGCRSVFDVVLFLDARILHSQVPPPFWIFAFRYACVSYVACGLELEMWDAVQDRQEIGANIVSDWYYGKSDNKRCNASTLTKMKWLRQIVETDGCNNTILNVLSDGHCGYGAVVQQVRTNEYQEAVARQQFGTTLSAYSWDGASYSGFSVNVDHALDIRTRHGCHLKPLVHTPRGLPIILGVVPAGPLRHPLATIRVRRVG